MMNIKVHRGLEQIGGCITEISTATSRVFIDFGQNLPGNGEATTPEQDRLMVENIFATNAKKHEAVFYTHGPCTSNIIISLHCFLKGKLVKRLIYYGFATKRTFYVITIHII